MNKRANKSSAHTGRERHKKLSPKWIILVIFLLVIIGAVTVYWLRAGPVDRKKFNAEYSEIQKEVSEGKYESAAEKAENLRSNGYSDDYRVLIVSADIENYLKNIDGAKMYADRVLGLYKENPLLLNKDQLNRMEGYSSKILLPSPRGGEKYIVPEEQKENADFQG